MSPRLSTTVVLISLAFFVQACAPVITHGPDVRSGFTGGLTAVLGNGPKYRTGELPGHFYDGAAVVSAGYGIRPMSDSRPAMRVGLQGPYTSDDAGAADLYVQTPRRWLTPVAAGIGVLAEFPEGRQMPYVQIGAKNRKGFGFDIAVGRYSTGRESAQVNWLSFEVPFARRASLYFRGGFASGHVTTQTSRSAPYVEVDRWVRLGGVTLELHR